MTTQAITTDRQAAPPCCGEHAPAATGLTAEQRGVLDELVARTPSDARLLVQLLQDLQKRLHWLPRPAMRAVAAHLGVPLAKVYAVATFYKAFSLVPRGEHLVRVCTGTACHVRGAALVADELQKQLGIQAGETTADQRYSLEEVNCVGACALAPVVMIDEDVHGAVAPGDAPALLEAGR